MVYMLSVILETMLIGLCGVIFLGFIGWIISLIYEDLGTMIGYLVIIASVCFILYYLGNILIAILGLEVGV